MLVADVLALHDHHRPTGALRRCLGDGYLLDRSPVFRRVRRLARAAGLRFTDRPPFEVALPLAALDSIHAAACVPYRDNVAPLRRIERAHPRRLALGELVALGLPSNYLLHESVHALVRRLGRGRPADPALRPDRARLLDLLLEESCANAVEALAACDRDDARFGSIMGVNNYLTRGHAAEARAAIGDAATLRLLVVGFLHANFLYREASVSAIDDALARVLSRDQRRALGSRAARALFQQTLALNPRFRLRTTPAYLKLAGFRGSIFRLLDFRFVDALEPGRRARAIVDGLLEPLTAPAVRPAR